MPSEYDALLEDTRKPSEYDALLAPPQSGPSVGQILKNAGQGAFETAKELVPKNLNELLGFATGTLVPAVGGVEDIGRGYGMLKDVLFGKPINEATAQNFPETQIIPQAEQTAPYSAERFKAGTGVLAQMGMAALGGKGLAETLKPISQVPEVPITNVAEQPIKTGGEINAEQIIEPTQVNGDVQYAPRPKEVQPLPTDVGGEGVPTRGQGETLQAPQEVAPVPQPEQPHPLQDQTYYRGTNPNRVSGEDTFYSAHKPTAEEYSAGGPEGVEGKVEEVKGQSLPENLFQATDKEELASKLGINEELYGTAFDNAVKAKLQPQGYEGVRYEAGTALGDLSSGGQEEIHVFSKPPSVPEASGATTAEPIPKTEPVQPEVAEQPHISAIANRFVEERAAKGEVGEIAPGKGYSAADLRKRGLSMPPERVNDAVSRVVQGGEVPLDDAAAIVGEEARLSQRSNQLSREAVRNPTPEAKVAADNAFKDLTDFHNGPVAQLKQNWSNQGKSLQGQIEVDLSTVNGLKEAWLRDVGESPPQSMEKTFETTAKKVDNSNVEYSDSLNKLSKEIDRVTRNKKLPSPDDLRETISERMKYNPCRT